MNLKHALVIERDKQMLESSFKEDERSSITVMDVSEIARWCNYNTEVDSFNWRSFSCIIPQYKRLCLDYLEPPMRRFKSDGGWVLKKTQVAEEKKWQRWSLTIDHEVVPENYQPVSAEEASILSRIKEELPEGGKWLEPRFKQTTSLFCASEKSIHPVVSYVHYIDAFGKSVGIEPMFVSKMIAEGDNNVKRLIRDYAFQFYTAIALLNTQSTHVTAFVTASRKPVKLPKIYRNKNLDYRRRIDHTLSTYFGKLADEVEPSEQMDRLNDFLNRDVKQKFIAEEATELGLFDVNYARMWWMDGE